MCTITADTPSGVPDSVLTASLRLHVDQLVKKAYDDLQLTRTRRMGTTNSKKLTHYQRKSYGRCTFRSAVQTTITQISDATAGATVPRVGLGETVKWRGRSEVARGLSAAAVVMERKRRSIRFVPER